MSTKRSVIRSLFLRAIRYSDAVYLDTEIERIYADFTRLGYPRRFIDKAKISAKKGRDHEIAVRASSVSAQTESLPSVPQRTRQPFTLVVPYHRQTRRLKSLYVERGIDVIYSNKDSIGSRVQHRDHINTDTGVYVIRCKDTACDKVYVGESGNIPRRLEEHRQAVIVGQPSKSNYATARHTHQGLKLDVDNAVVPYRSSSVLRRRIIEACLISLCSTVKGTKATSSTRDMDKIGPIILGASPIDWKLLATTHPTLPLHIVPKAHKKFFPGIPLASQGTIDHPPDSTPNPPSDNLATPRYNLRSGLS